MKPPEATSSALSSPNWARRLISTDRWAVLDFETTGLGPHAEPVEIAILDPTGAILLESLIQPTRPVHPAARRLHRIQDDALALAPTFPSLYGAIRKAVERRLLISYGSPFDRAILDQACRAARLPLLDLPWDCALTRYATWRGFTASLTIAAEIEHLTSYGRHRAAPDAHLVWQLIHRMSQSPNPL